jgi:hypothetical protein
MACSIARRASAPLLPEVACSMRRQSALELILAQKVRASDRVAALPKRFSISEASSRAILSVGPDSRWVRSSSRVQLRRALPVWGLRLITVSDASLNTGTSSIKGDDVPPAIMDSCDCGSMDARLSNRNPSGTERRSSGGSANALPGPTTSMMSFFYSEPGRNGCDDAGHLCVLCGFRLSGSSGPAERPLPFGFLHSPPLSRHSNDLDRGEGSSRKHSMARNRCKSAAPALDCRRIGRDYAISTVNHS